MPTRLGRGPEVARVACSAFEQVDRPAGDFGAVRVRPSRSVRVDKVRGEHRGDGVGIGFSREVVGGSEMSELAVTFGQRVVSDPTNERLDEAVLTTLGRAWI